MHTQIIKGMPLQAGAKSVVCIECAVRKMAVQIDAVVSLFVGKVKIHLCERHFKKLSANIQEAIVRLDNGT